MKPEFSKPFDLEQAKAGAPIATRGGEIVTILKWDGRDRGYPLIGIYGDIDRPETWMPDGQAYIGNESDDDLVMLPLGLIDGKPVFVGDRLVRYDGEFRTAQAEWWPDIKKTGFERHGYKWPTPEKVYPTTSMTFNELAIVHNAQLDSKPNEFARSVRAVANAALRHAIDAGQVFPVIANTTLHFGNPKDYLTIYGDEKSLSEVISMRMDLRKLRDDQEESNANRAARDMAIAEAVRDAAYVQAMNCQSGHEGTVIRQIDLPAVIATIK